MIQSMAVQDKLPREKK